MRGVLRRLLEPAPTSPTQDQSIQLHDSRPIWAQIASGFRIAGGLIAGFLVLGLASAGLATLSAVPSPNTRLEFLFPWPALCLSAILMVLTAHRWARFVTGFFFGPALPGILVVFVAGPHPDSFSSYLKIPRIEAAEMLAYFLTVIVLTWRFVRKHPPPTTFLDRLALTFFAFATLEQGTVPYHFPPLPLISGVSTLFIAWSIYRWERLRDKRRHRQEGSGDFDTISGR